MLMNQNYNNAPFKGEINENKREKWMIKRGIILAFISLFSFQVIFAQRITRQYNNCLLYTSPSPRD